MGGTGALAPLQVAALPWPALEQGCQPIDRTFLTFPGAPAQALIDSPAAGSGIRPLGGAGADAQGFFGQTGTSRRAAVAWGWAGTWPHCPCAAEEACAPLAGGCVTVAAAGGVAPSRRR